MNINNDLEISWYFPNIIESLRKINRESYFFAKHGMRNPAWMYGQKITSLWESMHELMIFLRTQEHDETDKDCTYKNNLSKLFKNFINNLDSIYDTFCELTLWLSNIERKSKFIHSDLRWIPEWETFNTKLRNHDLIKYFQLLSNKLNHTSPSIEYIEMISKNWIKVPWFCITTIDEKGSVVPHRDFHVRWDWMETWTSFNKIIKDAYFLIYYFSDLFDFHVITWKDSTNSWNDYKVNNDLYENIFNEIQKLEWFFPNEQVAKQFNCKVTGNRLKIQHTEITKRLIPHKFRFALSWDWETRSFCLIYYKWKQ